MKRGEIRGRHVPHEALGKRNALQGRPGRWCDRRRLNLVPTDSLRELTAGSLRLDRYDAIIRPSLSVSLPGVCAEAQKPFICAPPPDLDEPVPRSVPASSPLTGGTANVAHVLNLRVDAGVCQRKVIASLLAPRQTPPSSREAARAGFAELVQNHGSGR
jgi:hypothetical protein